MESIDPAAAFSKLADETRVSILRAVAEAERESDSLTGSPVLSFSELYDCVDVSNSSRFAYHLEQLTDVFLRKTDDGYAFTYAGERVVRTILSGAYNESATFESVALEERCPACHERALEARAEAVEFRIRCTACGQGVGSHHLKPGLVADRSPREIVDVVDAELWAVSHRLFEGVCPECIGELEREVRRYGLLDGDPFLVVARCKQCWSTYTVPVSMVAFTHPATIGFYWERGIDVRSLSFRWLIEALIDGRWSVERLESESPEPSPQEPSADSREAAATGYRVTVVEPIETGRETLRLEFDSAVTLEGVTRTAQTDPEK